MVQKTNTSKVMKEDTKRATQSKLEIAIKVEADLFVRRGQMYRRKIIEAQKELDEAKKLVAQNNTKKNSERLRLAQWEFNNTQGMLNDHTRLEKEYGKDGKAWAKMYVQSQIEAKKRSAQPTEKNYKDEIWEYTMAVEVHNAYLQNSSLRSSDLEKIEDRVDEDESISAAHEQKVKNAMKKYDELSAEEKDAVNFVAYRSMVDYKKEGCKNCIVLEASAIIKRLEMLSGDDYRQIVEEATKEHQAFIDNFEKNQIEEKYKEKLEGLCEKYEERGMSEDAAEILANCEICEKYRRTENTTSLENTDLLTNAPQQKPGIALNFALRDAGYSK